MSYFSESQNRELDQIRDKLSRWYTFTRVGGDPTGDLPTPQDCDRLLFFLTESVRELEEKEKLVQSLEAELQEMDMEFVKIGHNLSVTDCDQFVTQGA